jgi:D-glycero-alpha-D-manno-heptose-7-phosphate kinase
MRIIAQAPCRVDLAGGTLDIWPLYLFHPGAVTVNFAINRYTRCAIETLASPEIRLRSNDLNATQNFGSFAELDRTTRLRLPLATHLLRFFRPSTGLVMHTDSEAPAGAGISGSSALLIAGASALNRLTGSGHGPEKLREIAQNVEAQIIRVPAGLQDYYPALYGGVSAIELGAGGVRRVAIPVDLDDFNHRIVLCYTGAPRNSGINNWEVTKAYIDGRRQVQRNFGHIASVASSMRVAVKKADWTEAGRLLREDWSYRRKNAPRHFHSRDRSVDHAGQARRLTRRQSLRRGRRWLCVLPGGARRSTARVVRHSESRRRNPARASGRSRCHNSNRTPDLD